MFAHDEPVGGAPEEGLHRGRRMCGSHIGAAGDADGAREVGDRAQQLGVHPDIAGFDDLAYAFDLYGSLLAARATLEYALAEEAIDTSVAGKLVE